LNVLLIVPYNVFEAKHGNAIRVRALMDTLLKNGNRISLLMYDLPGMKNIREVENVKVYFRPVKFRVIAIAALMRLIFRASTYDLLCAKMEPFGGFEELVKEIIQKDEIDVIQCENVWTVPPLMSVISDGKLPIVVTAHDVLIDRFEQLYEYQGVPRLVSRRLLRSIKEIETRALQACETCVCVSEEDRRRLIEIGADPTRITVIPNGVDTSKIRPVGKDKKLAKELKLEDEDIVLFFPGSEMFQNKRAADDILKRILPKLDRRYKVVFAGTICSYLAKQNLPECVILAGYVEDLTSIYALVDIVVLPITIGSGTKLKTVEAMAAGKPIITTQNGAIGIDLDEDSNYIMIEDDLESFPCRIIELSQNEGLRNRMGREAREKALEYDWDILMKRYVEIYEYLKNMAPSKGKAITAERYHSKEIKFADCNIMTPVKPLSLNLLCTNDACLRIIIGEAVWT